MEQNTKIDLQKIKPLIFWSGFPVCGLLIKKVADLFKEKLIIIATRPKDPFVGLEQILRHSIIWLDNPNDIWNRKNEFADRNFIIHSGWSHKGWLKYDRYIKQKNKAKIVVAVDNRYRGDIKQLLGAVWFRFYLKKYFDASLVPGKAGLKLMKFLGMKQDRIYTGLYGAYEEIFKKINPIEKRNNEFLFIGQLNKRKAIDILIPAFKEYRKNGGKWTLRIVGSGELKNICAGDGIILEIFAQPNDIAQKMNSAKVLVLPSRDDNWGTVVCEAAACGMHIITTKNVAASEDIIQNKINGLILEKIDIENMRDTSFYFENLSNNLLTKGSQVSKDITKSYDSNSYFETFTKMVNDLILKNTNI